MTMMTYAVHRIGVAHHSIISARANGSRLRSLINNAYLRSGAARSHHTANNARISMAHSGAAWQQAGVTRGMARGNSSANKRNKKRQQHVSIA